MRRFSWFPALLVVAALMVVGLVGIVVAQDDDVPGRMGAGMMSNPMTGPRQAWRTADESTYLAEMVVHHREAVDAARELLRSDRPQLRAFARSIITTQSAQIDQMTAWLAEWYPGQPLPGDYRPMMRDLTDLTGDRLDRTFLEDMIGHHMAAVMMSQHLLLSGAEHEDVATLARSIRNDQHAEIVQMQQWLAQWYDATWHGHLRWGPMTMWGPMMGAPMMGGRWR